MTVELRVLGQVEVLVGGRPVGLGHARQRCVLAALLLDANQVVVTDRVVDRVWGESSPRRARQLVSNYLSRLRHLLATTGGEAVIQRRNGGYVLLVDPDRVDVHRFRELVTRSRTETDQTSALELLERAAAQWRGEALSGLDTPWTTTVREGLARERFAADTQRLDLALRLGRHAASLPELSDRAAAHPLDEHVAAQLMSALYRSGRQADALDHYRRLRARLASELGTEAGADLRRLHQQILTSDPALTTPERPVLAARVRVPRQLPARPRLFTGRSPELARLTVDLHEQPDPGGTMPISVIDGTGGVGKTWLALHWAHQHLDRFPDGQLYVNLRGFDPAGEPVAPEAAMRGFLDALGVAPAAVPTDPGARLGLYRSLLADRRLLVVLDNARDTAQVTSLLPGSPTCAVLVTSRHRLDGLTTAHGARSLELGTLTDGEARQLLARHLDHDRISAEPDAVTELLTHCAGLPLAISIVAARAGRHPRFPLAALAGELRDRNRRLDALDTGDAPANLRIVLSWSHHAMSPAATVAFGLLGLWPGTDISLPAAASLLALPVADAGRVLRELEHGHLVRQHTPGRYRMHDLVRLYAADRAHHDHPETGRTEALRRVVDFYVHTAFAGDRLLQPLLPPIELGEPAVGCHPCPLRDQRAALTWFTAEHPNLLAAQRLAAAQGWGDSVHDLAWILTTFLYREGRFDSALAVWQAGHAAVRERNDAAGEAGAHQLLGAIFAELGRPAEALRHLTKAEEAGDLPAQAYTHHTLGWFWSLQGDPRRALDHAGRARHLYRTLGLPAGETRQLTVTGWYHVQLGDHERARTTLYAALATARHHRYREDEALALGILGYIALHTGHHAAAVDRYRQSHTLLHEAGSTYFEANALDQLGQAHAALDEPGHAVRAWEQALELYRTQGRTAAADRVRHQLAALGPPSRPLATPTG